jgi:hypothetical protein
MPQFTRGLAEAGARVYGIGDQAPGALPELVQHHLAGYLPVRSLWDEAAVVEAVRSWPEARRLDGVECLWEPGMLLAARLREALGLRGLSVAQTVPFRDKEAMKQVLDRAGLRTPRHVRCTDTGACWEAAERIGYPIIVKPIAGAGSADTYRVESPDDLRSVLPAPGTSPRSASRSSSTATSSPSTPSRSRDTSPTSTSPGIGRARWSRAATSGSARRSSPCVTSTRRPSPRACASATTSSGRSDSSRASPTWSGTARPTARSCSARSGPAPPARTRSTR